MPGLNVTDEKARLKLILDRTCTTWIPAGVRDELKVQLLLWKHDEGLATIRVPK